MNCKSRLVAGCVLALLTCRLVASGEDKIEHTKDSVDTIKKNLADGKAVLLDVREPNEWKNGHLEQAQLAPLSQLKEGTDPKKLAKDLDNKKIVYCHCQAGRRALVAAEILKKQGYECRPLKQGYKELVEAGLPAAKEPAKP